MKQKIFVSIARIFLRFLLKLFSFLKTLIQGIEFFIGAVGKGAVVIFQALIPGVFFIYLKARRIRCALQRLRAILQIQRWHCFSHRYLAYILVGILALVASGPSLRAADAPPGAFGEDMLLRKLVNEEEQLIVDDTLPSDELYSYLEARFQNEQVSPQVYEPSAEARLPLTLDGVALLKQEVPGTIIPITRTEITEYEVEDGDTIWAIAEKFGMPVATVLWENQLSLYSVIRPGQKLTILPVAGVSHTVKNGDTLSSIAKRYRASEAEIKGYNNLEDKTALTLGIKLIIPGGRPYIPPPPSKSKPEPKPETARPAVIAVEPGGKLLWPVKSTRITQYFRWRHTGLDIGDKYGAPIYAAESGVVKIAGWGSGGWGYTVLLDHGQGMETRYAHASMVLVEKGQTVSKGEVIALVGSTGRSTGPHLHLGVYINGRAVNPLEYLR